MSDHRACHVKRFSIRADAQNARYIARADTPRRLTMETGLENAMEKKQTSGETTFTQQQIHRGSHCLQADCINHCKYCGEIEKPIDLGTRLDSRILDGREDSRGTIIVSPLAFVSHVRNCLYILCLIYYRVHILY